jgi:hypothetical protein
VSFTGFQELVTRKLSPNSRNAGRASLATINPIKSRRTLMPTEKIMVKSLKPLSKLLTAAEGILDAGHEED